MGISASLLGIERESTSCRDRRWFSTDTKEDRKGCEEVGTMVRGRPIADSIHKRGDRDHVP
jgi:hypothetical protein